MRTTLSQNTQQGRRPYQEDRLVYKISEDGVLAAIFDGHGGDYTSNFCAEMLFAAFDTVGADAELPTVIDKMRRLFGILNFATEHMEEGTTASIVYITPQLDKAVVGILGDSPVIIKNKGAEYWHAPEHNVRSNPNEVKRITKVGGYVHGGYAFSGRGSLDAGGLQLTRTLGDKAFSDILSRDPEIFEHELGVGSFVMVGSDGLFDPSHQSSSPAREIVELVERGREAGDLVKHAIDKPTHDNASAILVRILA